MDFLKATFKTIFWFGILMMVFGIYIGSQFTEFSNYKRLDSIDSTVAQQMYPEIQKNDLHNFFKWVDKL